MGMNHGTIRLILLIILTLIPILGPILSIFLVMGLSASRVWLLAAFIVDVLLIIATFGLSGIWRGIVDFSWSWSSFASYGVTYLLAWILAVWVVYKENKGQESQASYLSTGKSTTGVSGSSRRSQARRQRKAQAEMLASDSESEDDSADEEKRLGSGRDDVQDRRSRAAERLRNEAAGAGYAAGGLGR